MMENKQGRQGWHQLTQTKRDRMEALLDAGEKQREIARILKVDPSTVSRERKRKREDGRYDADAAQHKARVKRLNSKYQGMKVEGNPALRAHLVAELRKKRAPDEIAGRMERERMPFYASKNAIYKWLYSVWGQRYCRYLCTKRRRKRRGREKTAREMIPNRKAIWERPRGATNQTRYGHFEGDTIVAPKRARNTESVAIAAEMKSKFLVGVRIPSLSATAMTRAMERMNQKVAMKSCTMDNGIENKHHESWPVPAFFCDLHAPSQKPLIEGSIGLLRRWRFKKGTDWASVSERTLQNQFSFLNHKYRKSLNYQSAVEVATAHGIMKQKYPRRDCN